MVAASTEALHLTTQQVRITLADGQVRNVAVATAATGSGSPPMPGCRRRCSRTTPGRRTSVRPPTGPCPERGDEPSVVVREVLPVLHREPGDGPRLTAAALAVAVVGSWATNGFLLMPRRAARRGPEVEPHSVGRGEPGEWGLRVKRSTSIGGPAPDALAAQIQVLSPLRNPATGATPHPHDGLQGYLAPCHMARPTRLIPEPVAPRQRPLVDALHPGMTSAKSVNGFGTGHGNLLNCTSDQPLHASKVVYRVH